MLFWKESVRWKGLSDQTAMHGSVAVLPPPWSGCLKMGLIAMEVYPTTVSRGVDACHDFILKHRRTLAKLKEEKPLTK